MKKIIFICLFFSILGLEIKVFAQLSPLALGIQKYRQGDLEGAIADFETVLETDKENAKAKEYLLNCYITLGAKLTETREYNKALTFLERASKLAPEDTEIKGLYESVKAKLAPPTPPKPAVVPQPEEVKPAPVVPKIEKPVVEKVKEIKPEKITKPPTVEVKPTPTPPIEEKKRDEPRPSVKSEGELEEKITLILARVEREREDLLRRFGEWEEKEKRERQRILQESQKIMRRTIIIVASGLLILTFILLGPVYSNFKRSAKVRDKILTEYENKITKLIEEQKASLSSFISAQTQAVTQPEQEPTAVRELSPELPPLPEDILEKATPDLRFHAIEIIRKELNNENETEKIIATRLLERFINDRRKLIQIEALKTLYLYDPEKVIGFLKEKSKKPDLRVINAIAEIVSPESVDILISLIDSADQGMKREILRALKRFLYQKELPVDTINTIEQVISKIET